MDDVKAAQIVVDGLEACGYERIIRRKLRREEHRVHPCDICCFNIDPFSTGISCKLSYYCGDGYFVESLGKEPDPDKLHAILMVADSHM